MNTLLQLQNLDLRIEARKAREIEIPKQKEKYSIHRQRLEDELKQSEERCKALIVEQRECEGEIEQKQAQIAKYETQLLAVKKNEEYQALLHEIDTLKKQIGLKEERIIALMVNSDDAQAHFEEDKKRIADEREEIDGECKKIDIELAEAVKERKGLEEERKPLVPLIDAEMLRTYERIRVSKKTGAALVPLNDETCSGCFMKVTAQVVNEIMAGEKIHSCRHCGRLLYFAANFPDAPNAHGA